jgi:VIT1/CCC1 family predicted Fe2+/Mn2+ transporter
MRLLLRPSQWHGNQMLAGAIREIVFGAEDGAVQNTALIAGMVGASLTNRVIVIAGLINAVGGVLSMSTGTYLSSKAERDTRLARGKGAEAHRSFSPGRDAVVMAAAYASGALVPLAPFMLRLFDPLQALQLAVVATGFALFCLGAGKAIMSRQSIIRSGLEMLLLSAAAGFAGYLLGIAAGAFFGIEA